MKFSSDGYSLYVLHQCLVSWQKTAKCLSKFLGFSSWKNSLPLIRYFSYFKGLKTAFFFFSFTIVIF